MEVKRREIRKMYQKGDMNWVRDKFEKQTESERHRTRQGTNPLTASTTLQSVRQVSN